MGSSALAVIVMFLYISVHIVSAATGFSDGIIPASAFYTLTKDVEQAQYLTPTVPAKQKRDTPPTVTSTVIVTDPGTITVTTTAIATVIVAAATTSTVIRIVTDPGTVTVTTTVIATITIFVATTSLVATTTQPTTTITPTSTTPGTTTTTTTTTRGSDCSEYPTSLPLFVCVNDPYYTANGMLYQLQCTETLEGVPYDEETFVSSFTSCINLCTSDDECGGVVYDSPACYFYGESAEIIQKSATDYSAAALLLGPC